MRKMPVKGLEDAGELRIEEIGYAHDVLVEEPAVAQVFKYKPRSYTFHAIHEVDIEMNGDLDRVEATRAAIAYVRKYMQTLPPGAKLRQACPKRCSRLIAGYEHEPRWIIRCVIVREAKQADMGWEDLLDLDLPEELMPAAAQGGK